jgi:hypothetical protein
MIQFTSIRTKLYSLVPATLISVGIAVGIGLFVQSRYGIGGPVDLQMDVQKDFLSTVEPATFLLTQPVITLQSIETESNQSVLSREVADFHAQENAYRSAREKYLKVLPEGEARRLLERDLNQPAEELFQVARNEYIPLLVQGQPADRQKASQVLRDKIMPRYRDIRRVGERVLSLSREAVETEAKSATASARF